MGRRWKREEQGPKYAADYDMRREGKEGNNEEAGGGRGSVGRVE